MTKDCELCVLFLSPQTVNNYVKLLIIILAMLATGAGAVHSWNSRALFLQAALLSEAYNLTSTVKLRVSDHYVKYGVMPHDNDDADLPPPKSIFGTSVKRVAINRGGVLVVDFEEKIGAKSMTFTPTLSQVSGLLKWRCTSDSIDEGILERLKPTCVYHPASQESKLMHAIANKELLQVDKLLGNGARVDIVVNGNTPLMLAAKVGELSIVKRLLDGRAHVDNAAVNLERRTPLMVAITSNHSNVVALLLSHGASVTRKDYRGLTAMDHAIATDRRFGRERFVFMVAARQNPQFAGNPAQIDSIRPQRTDSMRQALYGELRRAATSCHVKRLVSLFRAENDLDTPELVLGKPIGEFIRKPACTHALLEHLQNKASYKTSIHAYFAKQIQQCAIANIEIAMKDNPELSVQHVHQGQSHFNRAISGGCTAVVRMMVRNKDLASKLPAGVLVSAIKQAPQDSLVTLVGNLITIGANVNDLDQDGQSPLAAAISLEQPVVAKYLVDAGADVNAPTINGSYPVIEATKKGYAHLVLQMVSSGADLNAADSLGRTALMAAVGGDRQHLVSELIQVGANARARDANGIDAIVLAESRNLRRIKKLLIASTD